MHSHCIDSRKYVESLQSCIPLVDHSPTSGQTSIQYPPFNLKKISDKYFKLEFAVYGFSETEIFINQTQNHLKIVGKKNELEAGGEYVYQEFSPLSFEREFDIMTGYVVNRCTLNKGVLVLDLHRDETQSKKIKFIYCAHPKLLDSV